MIATVIFWVLAVFESCRAERDRKSQQPPIEWQGYSVAFHLLLPVAGFLILWGKRDLFNKLMLQVDRNCVSVLCPPFRKRQKILKWAVENLPSTWSSSSRTLTGGIPDLWKDGSLLCTLINMAVPGACQNAPTHWKKPPIHAQALAYKYLGITPVFGESDFKEPLTPNQERKFLVYLQDLQQAIKSRSTKEEASKFTQNYLAKGMGLHNADQHKKTTFYVYSNTTNSNCSNVLVYLRGPYGTQGTATIPAFYNRSPPSLLNCLHRQHRSLDKIVFKKEARKSFLMTIAMDFSSLVNFERRSTVNDIPVHVEIETDRAKVTYIPINSGIYEINLISNGELLINSPFTVSVTENSSGTKESFDTSEKILELPTLRRRRIVAKFIDCINEKILLKSDCADRSSVMESADTESTNFGTAKVKPTEKTVKFAHETLKMSLPMLSITEHEENTSEHMDNAPDHLDNASEHLGDALENLDNASDHLNNASENLDNASEHLGNASEPPKISDDYCSDTPMDSLEIFELEQPKTHPSKPPATEEINETSNMQSDDVATEESNQEAESIPEPCAEDYVQKRPTSIVTPFLITTKTAEKNEQSTKAVLENLNESNKLNPGSFETEENEDVSFNPRELILMRNDIKNSYVEKLKAILVNKLTESENTKTIKNWVNTSNKLKSLKEFQDENNNSLESTTLRVTSPICHAHIAPEVEIASTSPIPVSEKRKLFTRQSCLSLPSSNNSSFSEKENGEVAKEFDEKYSLRLLSVIDTIRNSANSSLSRSISNSTPNISTSKSCHFGSNSEESRSSFIETREYWMTLSCTSINSTSSKTKHDGLKSKLLVNKMFTERYRSAEDISSVARVNFGKRLTKSHSLNQKDFEAIDFVSLEDRKKMLLQDQYEKERMGSRFIKRKIFSRVKSIDVGPTIQRTQEEEIKMSGVDATNTPKIHAQELKQVETFENSSEKQQKESKQPSQFKRAFNFFKNLERSSFQRKKPQSKPKPEIKRRFSLDLMDKKKDRAKVGGSLRIPKTSDKFSISRIYFDIMETKNGSFKGVPNKEALSESLASLNAKTEEILDRSDDPVRYNMFWNKGKPRKRRSLKSVFNIHY